MAGRSSTLAGLCLESCGEAAGHVFAESLWVHLSTVLVAVGPKRAVAST